MFAALMGVLLGMIIVFLVPRNLRKKNAHWEMPKPRLSIEFNVPLSLQELHEVFRGMALTGQLQIDVTKPDGDIIVSDKGDAWDNKYGCFYPVHFKSNENGTMNVEVAIKSKRPQQFQLQPLLEKKVIAIKTAISQQLAKHKA